MEEYHIVRLNTSSLGKNLLNSSSTSTSSAASPTKTGFFSNILHNITSEIADEFESIANDIGNDIADKLADKLGIEQWYSWHLMDFCQGKYTPNATAKSVGYNITSCSKKVALYHFDIEDVIGSQLEIGPLHINTSDINFPQDIQDGLNDLSAAVDAIFVLYAIAIACSGLAIITGIIAFIMNTPRLVTFGNICLTGLGFLTLLIPSIALVVVQNKAAHLINKYGNDIGVYAYKGAKYLIITWVATAVLALANIAWMAEFILGKKRKQREFSEKKPVGRRGWFGGRKRSDEANLRRSGV